MRVWTKTDRSDRVKLPLTSSRGKSLTLYGSVSLVTTEKWVYTKGKSTNQEEFCEFLEALRSKVKP